MPFLLSRGRALAYHHVGDGHPLVLLHPFPLSSESFWPQLEAPPPGYRLLAPDLPGFGRSDLLPGPATMEAYAQEVLRLMDALDLGPAVVGGVSMGGYVAMAVARLDPGRVRGLLLLDTRASGDDEAGRAAREATAVSLEQRGMDVLVEGLLPRLLAPQAAPQLRQRVEALMRAQSPAAAAAATRGMATRGDAKDILSRFAGPSAVLVGELDTITPVEAARQLQQLLAGAVLEVIPGAGHLAHLERPEAVAAALERFRSRL